MVSPDRDWKREPGEYVAFVPNTDDAHLAVEWAVARLFVETNADGCPVEVLETVAREGGFDVCLYVGRHRAPEVRPCSFCKRIRRWDELLMVGEKEACETCIDRRNDDRERYLGGIAGPWPDDENEDTGAEN